MIKYACINEMGNLFMENIFDAYKTMLSSSMAVEETPSNIPADLPTIVLNERIKIDDSRYKMLEYISDNTSHYRNDSDKSEFFNALDAEKNRVSDVLNVYYRLLSISANRSDNSNKAFVSSMTSPDLLPRIAKLPIVSFHTHEIDAIDSLVTIICDSNVFRYFVPTTFAKEMAKLLNITPQTITIETRSYRRPTVDETGRIRFK